MFDHLHIYDRRERMLVGATDIALRVAAPAVRVGRRRASAHPKRILLLRLERIGDLLMSLEAIDDVRRAARDATIDLVVGSWNAELARRIPGIDHVEILDAGWLSRNSNGGSLRELIRRAREWAKRHYDLAVNFEPDVRTNMLLALSRASRIAGFATGGGGAVLDVALPYDPRTHTTANARRLVAAVLDVPSRTTTPRLELRPEERCRAAEVLGTRSSPLVGIHVSGGRAIKQWDVDRFAELAVRIAAERAATIVLTGSAEDRPLVDRVRRLVPAEQVMDVAGGLDLPSLAALIERLDLFVTGDTGPMHVAAAVGTPIVAIFGPSDPTRYAATGPMHQVVRVDLPCSPCNRIRLPPERCTGHTPDCLAGIDVEMVHRAVRNALDRAARRDVERRTFHG